MEEAEEIIESPEVSEADNAPEQEQGQEQNKSDKPAGYYPVDPRKDSPEAVEQRINYIYKQLKDDKRTLDEYRNIAEMQSRTIEELRQGMGTVVHHLAEKETSETEATLKSQAKAAFESGDTDKYWEIQGKLDDLRIEKKLAAMKPKETVKPQEQRQTTANTEESYIAQEDLNYINVWQDEKDSNGNLLRPWAHNYSPDPNNPDPEYVTALLELQAVLKSPRFKDKPMSEKVAEVDRRMGLQKTTKQNTVMGGNLTGQSKPARISLTPKQQEIALRTVPLDGKKIKNDADKLEWYRKQVEATRGAKK